MSNNAMLFNAALSGFYAGALAAGPGFDATQADYANTQAVATVFATAVDTALVADTAGSPQPAGTVGISSGGGSITGAGTSGLVEAQDFKPGLLQLICYNYGLARGMATAVTPALTATSPGVVAAANAIKAQYLQCAGAGNYT